MADPPKRQKLQNTDDIGEKLDTSGTYFDIINIDCIESIFDFLSPIDLLNIADLNTRTTKAAEIVYARHYSNNPVEIYISSNKRMKRKQKCRPIVVGKGYISIYSADVCSSYVETFGELFKELTLDDRTIDDTPITEEWRKSLQMIQNKCAKHLTEFTLMDRNKRIFKEFQTPFEKVEDLCLDDSFSLGQSQRLNDWFPVLKRFQFINFGNYYDYIPSNVKMMIKSAPKLEKLKWGANSWVNASDLRYIQKYQPELKSFTFNWSYDDAENETLDKISFKNMETCRIIFRDSSVRNLPLKFERLNNLLMHYPCELASDNDIDNGRDAKDAMAWIDFASEQIELNELFMKLCGIKFSKKHLIKLVSHLTKLTELTLLTKFDFDALDYVLSHCKSLQTLEIDYPSTEVRNLCTKFSTHWTMNENILRNAMIFKRK